MERLKIFNAFILLISVFVLRLPAFLERRYFISPNHLRIPRPLPGAFVVDVVILCVLPALLISMAYMIASILFKNKNGASFLLRIFPVTLLATTVIMANSNFIYAEFDYSSVDFFSFFNPVGTVLIFPHIVHILIITIAVVFIIIVMKNLKDICLPYISINLYSTAKKIIVVVFMITTLLLAVNLLSENPTSIIFPDSIVIADSSEYETNIQLSLTFSEVDHFYSNGISVEITTSMPSARIFYTTDGTIPLLPMQDGFCDTVIYEYKELIYFPLEDELYSVVLRAIAIYETMDEDVISPLLTHTYFIGRGINERFGDDIYVFSLSTNPDYLFDYNIGVLANPWGRGRDWERPINVEVFTSYGDRVLTQVLGARIHGNSSRNHAQQTLRLIARRDYSPESGRFQYDFFPCVKAYDGSPVTGTDTVTLRGFRAGMIRNELGVVLADRAGLIAPSVRPASVFINGEYRGFFWLQHRIEERYLQSLFNAPTNQFDIVNRYRNNLGDYEPRIHDDLQKYYSFTHKNLRDDAIFADLKAIMCVENYLLHSAFQIYIGNFDWPGNGGINLRRWRYFGEQMPGLPPELDGRWRFAMNDLDASFLFFNDIDITCNTLEGFLRNRSGRWNDNPFLANILYRSDMADKFTMMLCDIAASAASAKTINDTIDVMFTDAVWSEMEFSNYRWGRSIAADEEIHEDVRYFAENRARLIFENLADFFSFSPDMFYVNIVGGEAIIGTQRGVSTRYFNHLVIPVSPVLPDFHEFEYWILNGQHIDTPDIMVSFADAVNDVVKLELVTRLALPPLVIAEAYVINHENGLVLVNLNNQAIHTAGLYLSDNSRNPFMWRLPDATIIPGERLELAGRTSRETSDIFRIHMGFNIREHRLLLLSDETGKTLDTFTIRTGRQTRNFSTITNDTR